MLKNNKCIQLVRRSAFALYIAIIFAALFGCNSEQASGMVETNIIPESALITESSHTSTISPTMQATPEITETLTPTPTMLSPTPEPKIYVGQVVCTAEDSVNIREKAGTSSNIIGYFPAGETAGVIEYLDKWAYIDYDGLTGYVSREYTINSHMPATPIPIGEWTEVFINPTHSIPKDYPVELADFEGGKVDARILNICEQMFKDAKNDGIDFKLDSAYRSYDYQSELYQKKVNDLIRKKGYSQEKAETEAAKITARPGTSEHQTGLALDIVSPTYRSMNSGFANTKAFKWLNANAWNYGFIMRYPKNKTDITKIIFEPWHWRFVGQKAALAMKKSGQCYEEYKGITD